MGYYLFEERFSKNLFIVCADSLGNAAWVADGIVQNIGEKYNEGFYLLNYIKEITEDEAEMSGLNIY